jgi:hypothetical protein
MRIMVLCVPKSFSKVWKYSFIDIRVKSVSKYKKILQERVYDFRTLGKIQKYLLKKNIFESV